MGQGLSEPKNSALWLRRLIILLLPLFLGFSWITWVIGPAYPRVEYAQPDFPPDQEQPPLTAEERLALALVAVSFLESWQPPEAASTLLARQQLPHGGGPLYTPRELSHLRDVKQLTDRIRMLALATAVPVLGGLFFLLRKPPTRYLAYLAVGQGGVLTVILLSGLIGLILFGWSFFFYQFHGLLFSSGSWSFAADDGLMRLYPERFFFDGGLLLSVGTWLWGMLAAIGGYFLAWRCGKAAQQERVVAHVVETV
ncbi:MAG: DUF1461 domain-containing protein [Candidatus Promineifilaceae bacterium]